MLNLKLAVEIKSSVIILICDRILVLQFFPTVRHWVLSDCSCLLPTFNFYRHIGVLITSCGFGKILGKNMKFESKGF